jgi:hypothetical protein
MLITNPNQIALTPDSRGLIFYDERGEPFLEFAFAKPSLATELAVDCLAVAQELLREYAP